MNTKREDKSTLRTKTLSVLLTEREKKMLESRAREMGMTVSTFVRLAVLKLIDDSGDRNGIL